MKTRMQAWAARAMWRHAIRGAAVLLVLALSLATRPATAASSTSAITPKSLSDLAVIDEQPIGRTVTEGGPVALSVSVHGTTPILFQWQNGGQPVANSTRVSGATNSVLSIEPVQLTDGGDYSVVVTHKGVSITSAVVSLVVSQLVGGVTQLGSTGFLVYVLGQPADVYRIEASTNFGVTWATNGYVTNFTGRANFVDGRVGVSRLYRVRFERILPILYATGVGTLQAYGKLNEVWRFDFSENLMSWNTFTTITNATGRVYFVDPSDAIPLHRFYRIAPP